MDIRRNQNLSRRLIFLTPLLSLNIKADTLAPTDVDKLNKFIKQYNIYVTKLNSGEIDIQQWARVVKAWLKL